MLGVGQDSLFEKSDYMSIDYREQIRAYLQKEIEILNALDKDAINAAMNLLIETFEAEKNIYIFGNGGSAATASHYQNDFNKGISEYTKKKFRFVCLNDNVPTIMAIANDIGYEEIFRFQLRGRLAPGDIVIGISGSGNSPNVIRTVEYAKAFGNKIVGVTGFNGGKLKQMCDVSLHVPVNSMQITEDIHMIFDHMMMAVFYKTLAGKEHLRE
jgi:D-sedoheptulose 7-phosphate isomerase